jgi:predicted ATP-dependent protease
MRHEAHAGCLLITRIIMLGPQMVWHARGGMRSQCRNHNVPPS